MKGIRRLPDQSRTTITVCVACAAGDDPVAGETLFDRIAGYLKDDPTIEVRTAECLAVCERPVTVAFQAPGKWTYLLGNVDETVPLDDIVAAARAVAKSPTGVPAMADRPAFFENGVICRVPPVTE